METTPIEEGSNIALAKLGGYALPMHGFPQPSSNPRSVEPRLFGACFSSMGARPPSRAAGLSGRPEDPGYGVLGPNAEEEELGVLVCVFAWDPSRPRTRRGWPDWGGGLQMCDWKGGKVGGAGLDDFVVFGGRARRWLLEAGMDERADLGQVGRWMARASMDFLHERHGAPLGEWSSMAWVLPGAHARHALDHVPTAKRLILAQWEADQLSEACSEEGRSAGSRRI